MMSLYRGTISYDDDEIDEDVRGRGPKGRDPVKRLKWYRKYWKSEKYLTYQREKTRERRAKKRAGSAGTPPAFV